MIILIITIALFLATTASADHYEWVGISTETTSSFSGLVRFYEICQNEFDDNARACRPGEVLISSGNDEVAVIIADTTWTTASCSPSLFDVLTRVTLHRTGLFSTSISRIQPVVCCAPSHGPPH